LKLGSVKSVRRSVEFVSLNHVALARHFLKSTPSGVLFLMKTIQND
jgi:hypothetical protein